MGHNRVLIVKKKFPCNENVWKLKNILTQFSNHGNNLSTCKITHTWINEWQGGVNIFIRMYR